MAGMGTCLWQGFPEFNNMRIIRAIKEAGSIYNTPDTRIGYGIPDMKKAFSALLVDFATSTSSVNGCNATLNWSTKDIAAMRFEIMRKAPGDASYTKIADVAAQNGTILSNHSYTFNNTLSNVAAGTISYIVRQVIDTASASFTAVYLDTTNINLASACTTTATTDPSTDATRIIVSPNPASSGATLIIQTTNAITDMPVVIYDMKGQLLLQIQSSKAPGKTVLDLPVRNFAKGKYIIQVFNAKKLLGSAELLKL
jgi:hypothetical protein